MNAATVHTDPPEELATAAAALRDGRLHDAVAAYDRALEGFSVDAHPEWRGTALLGRGFARQLLGDTGHATGDIMAALNAWSRARADWVSIAMADLATALTDARQGAADAFWQAALRLAERSGDVRLQAVISGEWGRHAARTGESAAAAALLEKAAELGRRVGDDATVATALVNLARIELDGGDGGDAARNVGEALVRDPDGVLGVATTGLLIDVAATAYRGGDAAAAELCLEQALELGANDRQVRERALAALSGLARARNDLPRAADLGRRLLESAHTAGDRTVMAEALHDLGRLALSAGAIDEAAACLTDSLVLARMLRLHPLAAAGSRALAEVAVRRGALLRALGYAEQAVALSTGEDDLDACAATLTAVGAEAQRRKRQDVADPAYLGAAEIHRSAGRSHLADSLAAAVSSGGSGVNGEGSSRVRLETGLDVARRVLGDAAS